MKSFSKVDKNIYRNINRYIKYIWVRHADLSVDDVTCITEEAMEYPRLAWVGSGKLSILMIGFVLSTTGLSGENISSALVLNQRRWDTASRRMIMR